MKINKKLGLLALCFLFLLISCERKDVITVEEYEIVVDENSQITYKDLKLGVGAIFQDQYTDLSGKEKSGYTVKLWPYLKYEETGRSAILVYEGLSIDIDKYTIRIKDITKNDVKLILYERTPVE